LQKFYAGAAQSEAGSSRTPSPQGLILTHKFFRLVARPFQAVQKSLAQVENLCHQKLVESTTSPLIGNA
jgi:hypothetical protein